MLPEKRGGSWHPVDWPEGLDLGSLPQGAGVPDWQWLLRGFGMSSGLLREHLVEASATHWLLVLVVGASPPAASDDPGPNDH